MYRDYWQIFGGQTDQHGTPCWKTVIIGPTEYAVPCDEELEPGIHWLRTMSGHPTEADLTALVPQEHL